MFEEYFNIVQERRSSDLSIQVLEEKKTEVTGNSMSAMHLYNKARSGSSMKIVKIILSGGSVQTVSRSIYHINGKLKWDVSANTPKDFRKEEAFLKPIYRGYGEIYLEPSYHHYFMINLNDDSVIVDKSIFYCCSGSMKVEPLVQKNIFLEFKDNKKLSQTKISGTGVVVFTLPLLLDKIQEIYLSSREEIKIISNYVIAQTKGINVTLAKSDKNIFCSLINDSGQLNTYKGEGFLWISPPSQVYKKMKVRADPALDCI